MSVLFYSDKICYWAVGATLCYPVLLPCRLQCPSPSRFFPFFLMFFFCDATKFEALFIGILSTGTYTYR